MQSILQHVNFYLVVTKFGGRIFQNNGATDTVTVVGTYTDLLPETEEQRNKVAEEWAGWSDAFGLFDGCLAAIDGWLCTKTI